MDDLTEGQAEHDELIALADRLALAQSGEAVSKEPSPEFTEWLLREIPPGTVISSPKWWLPRIWRRATEGLCRHASSADRVAELEAQLAAANNRLHDVAELCANVEQQLTESREQVWEFAERLTATRRALCDVRLKTREGSIVWKIADAALAADKEKNDE